MRSMTGYGCGEAAHDGCRVTVELSSVNRRQAEIAVSLPRELEVLEARMRGAIGEKLARGRVTGRVTLHAAEDRRMDRLRVNRSLAASYAKEFTALADELGLCGGVSLDVVLRAPGVLEGEEQVEDAERFWPAVEAATCEALRQLVQMREQEGAHLGQDLAERLGVLRRCTSAIRTRAPGVAEHYRSQLQERLAAIGVSLTEDDRTRLMKEVALFADRSDITEELTRLESHFAQFETCLASTEPVGRTLDFLTQEMNREVNTIGSKANDAGIAHEVVQLKAELERIREQAQNLE